jgi:hypothetical protein
MKRFLLAAAMLLPIVCGCSRSNNLLLGRIEHTVGSHRIVVTDCYRMNVPPAEVEKAPDGRETIHDMPCRDADIVIADGQLKVNGVTYGAISAGDGVIVDHGAVSIERSQSAR